MKDHSFDSSIQQLPGILQTATTTPSSKKFHSILPDLMTGWKPKNITIPPPILITYECPLTQEILKETKNLDAVLYSGYQYPNSYMFHSRNIHDYSVKYGVSCQEMPISFQKSLDQLSSVEERPFCGMNPRASPKSQLQFDSNFQSGNLDLVIKCKENEYDLFLRPDTNTCGHMQWFYFKIIKPIGYKQKSIQLNICNNRKPKTLYCRGMKPYVHSRFLKESKGQEWRQTGNNVKYEKLEARPQWLQSQEAVELKENSWRYTCLSFEYEFEAEEDEIHFAYCPPFTYSAMKAHLQQAKKAANSQTNCQWTEERLCDSLSGLDIPVITITDSSIPQENKNNVIAMGRIHPGQSNGSHVIKGFIDFLVSPAGASLRRRAIFKIIPMINPDGVVFGNYRTGLAGKDLNRKFKAKNIDLFPEIIHLRDYCLKYKISSNAKFTNFLDFHGHSIKKNVFFYGPQYDIWSTKYQRAKVLPRMLATRTEMFRYQSCLFRVSTVKKTTARAFMLGFIPYCYTIESSTGMYRSFKEGKDVGFTVEKWEEMGRIVGETLNQSFIKIYEEIFVQEVKKKKKNPVYSKVLLDPISEYPATLTREIKENQENKTPERSCRKISSVRSNSPRSYQRSIRNLKKVVARIDLEFPQINEQECESDRYSEGKSDCESQGNDLSKQKYKALSGKIMRVIDGFNQVLGGPPDRKNYLIKMKANKKKYKKKRKTSTEEMKLVPSLRHKSLKRNLSEKKIGYGDGSEQSFLKFNRILV